MEILEQSFDLMFVKWVPRDKNIEANQHAQQALYKLINKKEQAIGFPITCSYFRSSYLFLLF